MFYHDSTWKLYNTGWPDHAKDEGHTGRVPELRFLSSSGSSGAAVVQRLHPSHFRVERANCEVGHHPGQAAMVQCTGEQPRDQRLLPCFTMLFRPHHLRKSTWNHMQSLDGLCIMIFDHICCAATPLYYMILHQYIYIYTHNINIIFCQRYLSIHARRIFALKRIRLSDGMHIHFSAKRSFILQVLEVETRTSRPNAEHGRTMQKYSFEKYGAQSLFWEKSVALTVVHRQRRER